MSIINKITDAIWQKAEGYEKQRDETDVYEDKITFGRQAIAMYQTITLIQNIQREEMKNDNQG